MIRPALAFLIIIIIKFKYDGLFLFDEAGYILDLLLGTAVKSVSLTFPISPASLFVS